MYLSNKYTQWYYLIIENAKHRLLPINIYYETHHIIPKSFGGDNSTENLVKLTAREHYVCHRLLPKMTEGIFKRKMIYALWCMINVKKTERYKINSREYDLIRSQFSNIRKLYRHSKESRSKISIGNTGKTVSADTKHRMSTSALNRGNLNTPAVINKSKNTKKQNGTNRLHVTNNANIKRVNTRRKNGAIDTWVKHAHSPAARKKAAASRRKTFIAIDPHGNSYTVTNLKQFCITHNLTYNGMCHSANGVREFHRGWKCMHLV
jgi:hypothetical protein